MNLYLRRRLSFGVIALVAIWPLVHLMLVDRYLINPWELGGWAMYVQPNAPLEVNVRLSSGETVPRDRLERPALQAYDRYHQRAAVLGLLASPGELANAMAEAGYNPDELSVEMRRVVIEADGRWSYRIGKRKMVER